jgi:sugar phosphate isomerase/epimerase
LLDRRTFLTVLTAAGLSRDAFSADTPGWRSSFFLMDTWFWEESRLTIPGQTALMKKLGYAGLALSWGQKHAERLAALKAAGLTTPGCYITVNIDNGVSQSLKDCVELLRGTGGHVWLALTSKVQQRSDAAGDEAALAIIKSCAELCAVGGVPGIALYPHGGFWMEKVGDAVRLAEKARRSDVGLQFNQYHWMTADGARELRPTLQAALPYLKGVSINGSGVKASILPLGEGEYDVRPILKTLAELGYNGPISHQGFGIKGKLAKRLAAAMWKWKALRAVQQ